MAANLQAYKLATNEGSSTTKQNNMIQAIQDDLNGIGDTTKNAWASGKIIDLNQLEQSGAAVGQVPMYNGTTWAAQTPPGSAYVLIADSTLGADGLFSFTGIPATYKHLELYCYLRTDRAATTDGCGMRLNNDIANNYDSYTLQFNALGPTVTPTEAFAATSGRPGVAAGNTAGANLFSSLVITIPHYAGTTDNKIAQGLWAMKIGAAAGNLYVGQSLAAWRSSAAVNRIDLLPSLGGVNFKSGSRVSLYGV